MQKLTDFTKARHLVNSHHGYELETAIADALANEREACALIADNAAFAMSPGPLYSAGFVGAKKFIASRIRGDG